MEIVWLLIGIIIGILVGFLLSKYFSKTSDEMSPLVKSLLEEKTKLIEDLQVSNQSLDVEIRKLSIEKATIENDRDNFKQSSLEYKTQLQEVRENLSIEKQNAAKLLEKQSNLEMMLATQKKELLEIQKEFTKEFENIANKVLDAKTEKFNEQSRVKLGEILVPFQERINHFKAEIEKSTEKSSKERIELKEHIKHLSFLNESMQKETQNLTLALKQDSKAQGNWGEVILERVLESSGLTKNREYFTQETFTHNDSATMLRPDVIVKLPDNKNVIIDAKVSLTAYNQLINAANENERGIALKAHLISIRNHINNLAGKNYQFAEGLDTPDFVLLFMPIESSFSVATQADNELFNFAWSKKIVVVSPSTLLATLRTIASIWKHEYQNKNALEIADRAGKMYDKFVGFVEDIENIGIHIGRTDKAYQDAMGKLTLGRGNLIGMAQKVIDLGVKKKKNLPPHLINDKNEEE